MKYVKLPFKLLCLFVLLGCLSKGWQLITDGFRFDKIKTDYLQYPKLEIAKDTTDDILPILDQKFKYLAKGCQTYVFESEDKNYVIKFVRYHRYKLGFWLTFLKDLSSFQNYHARRLNHKNKIFKESLNSYKLAYDRLQDETAIVYIHLNKTSYLNRKLKIVDRLNRLYLVDLDTTGFIIQKKTSTLKKTLKNSKKDLIQMHYLVDSFLETISSMLKKGCVNKDYHCVKNAGFFENKVLLIDVGSFHANDTLHNQENFKKEMIHFTMNFKRWAKKYKPEIIPYYENKIDDLSANWDDNETF